jgi:hypothetical protein
LGDSAVHEISFEPSKACKLRGEFIAKNIIKTFGFDEFQLKATRGNFSCLAGVMDSHLNFSGSRELHFNWSCLSHECMNRALSEREKVAAGFEEARICKLLKIAQKLCCSRASDLFNSQSFAP